MDAQNKEVDALVQKITSLHTAIAKLSSLSPSPDVDALFTDLVTACIPPSSMDVTKLGPEAQEMREGIIRLCSEAEGKLEAHYSDMLAAFDNPLDHLGMFPYYSNYINLSKLECELQARYVPGGIAPARVAFIGSGPLSFSSYVLAAARRHVRQLRPVWRANDRGEQAVHADKDVGAACLSTPPTSRTSPRAHRVLHRFSSALPGMAADKAKVITHSGARMTGGLVRRSSARGAWVPLPDRRPPGHRSRRV
ncbi:hypothetical protein ZWY2020_034107 [Hordeum vulgare]|nr:hypothetical protein ZWY2020_034107 [Hordeum vulgare]